MNRSATLMDTEVSIYGLVDPRTDEVRYIGKAVDPERRFRAHLEAGQIDRYRTHKNSWLKQLQSLGLQPRMVVLAKVFADRADDTERQFIFLYRAAGVRLTNGTDGGDGGAMPSEVAKAAGLKRRGRTHSDSERLGRQKSLQEFWAVDHPEATARRKQRSELSRQLGLMPPANPGELNPIAKLTDERVRWLRQEMIQGNLTLDEVAAQLNVTKQCVWSAATGKSWTHVEGPVVESKNRQRLSDADIEEIRRRVLDGEKQTVVARSFGIHPSHVSRMLSGARSVRSN